MKNLLTFKTLSKQYISSYVVAKNVSIPKCLKYHEIKMLKKKFLNSFAQNFPLSIIIAEQIYLSYKETINNLETKTILPINLSI